MEIIPKGRLSSAAEHSASVTSPRDRGEALILHERHPSHVVSTLITFGSAYSNTQRHRRITVETITVSEWKGDVQKGFPFEGIEERKIRRGLPSCWF